MKQKSNPPQPATKVDIQELREHVNKTFATKRDLHDFENRLEKKFASKKDLKELEDRLEKRFEKKFATKTDLKNEIEGMDIRMDLKLDNLERRIDENARQYRDEILMSSDKLAKRFETIWEEFTVGDHQTHEKIENHEKRI